MKTKWRMTLALAAMVTGMFAATLTVSAEGVKDVFDAKYYADTYPDLKAAYGYDEGKLFQHYMKFGLAEGRVGSPTFNVVEYRRAYPDLEAAFGNDWDAYVDHYFKFGKVEGRTAGAAGAKPAAASAGTAETQQAASGPASPSYIQHGSKFYAGDWTPLTAGTMSQFNGQESYIECNSADGLPRKIWVSKELTVTDNDYWNAGSGAPEGYEVRTIKFSVRNRLNDTAAIQGLVNAMRTGDFDYTKWNVGWESANAVAKSVTHTSSTGENTSSSNDTFTINYNGVEYTACSVSVNMEYTKFHSYPYLNYTVSVCLPKGCNDFAVKVTYPGYAYYGRGKVKTETRYIPLP